MSYEPERLKFSTNVFPKFKQLESESWTSGGNEEA